MQAGSLLKYTKQEPVALVDLFIASGLLEIALASILARDEKAFSEVEHKKLRGIELLAKVEKSTSQQPLSAAQILALGAVRHTFEGCLLSPLAELRSKRQRAAFLTLLLNATHGLIDTFGNRIQAGQFQLQTIDLRP